jgi:hypothetical protein
MSKEKDQQKQADSQDRDGAHHVDTDGEHNQDTSRRASNAGLRGEVRVAEVDKKEKDHDASGAETYQATAAQLRLLAREMWTSTDTVVNAMQGGNDNEAGDEPRRQSVEREFEYISGQVANVYRLISAMDPSLKTQLAKEVTQVNSAYTHWATRVHQANAKFGIKVNEAEVTTKVRGLDAAIGFDQPLTGAAAKLEGGEDELASGAVTEHLEAIISAGQSYSDGNTGDAKRVTASVVALAGIAERHPKAFKKAGKLLAKAVKAAKAVAAADAQLAPTINTALKALPSK